MTHHVPHADGAPTVLPVLRPSETEHAIALLARFFAEEGFAGDAMRIARHLAAIAVDDDFHVALAWAGDAAIGVVTISVLRSVEDGLQGGIGDLYVAPGYRRRGAARALMEHAFDWSRSRGCGGIEVVATPEAQAQHILAFYEKFGFRRTGRVLRTGVSVASTAAPAASAPRTRSCNRRARGGPPCRARRR